MSVGRPSRSRFLPDVTRAVPVFLALLVLGAAGPATADGTQARTHYERGRSYFQVGEYRKAVEEFKAAHVEKNDPAYIYNIAECHRQLGDSKEAVVFYRRFLALSPAGHPLRPDAQRRIGELEAQPPPRVAEPVPVPPPVVAPQPAAPVAPVPGPAPAAAPLTWVQPAPVSVAPPPGPAPVAPMAPPMAPPIMAAPGPDAGAPMSSGVGASGARRTPAYVAGGVALVALGIGGYFALDARAQWKDSQPHCRVDVCDSDGARLSHGAQRSALIADVTVGAGLLAAGVAVWLYVRAGREPVSTPAAPVAGRVRFIPQLGTEGRAGLTLASSW